MDSTSSTNKQDQSLVVIVEEDDEFLEFEDATWTDDKDAAQETQQWQDDWDVDDADNDFCNQLREELAKNK